MHRRVRYSTPGRSSVPFCTVGRDRQRGQRTIVAKVAIVEPTSSTGTIQGRVNSTPITCKRSKFTKVNGPGVVHSRGRQPVAEVYFQSGIAGSQDFTQDWTARSKTATRLPGVRVRIELAAVSILHRSTSVINGDNRSFAVAHVLNR